MRVDSGGAELSVAEVPAAAREGVVREDLAGEAEDVVGPSSAVEDSTSIIHTDPSIMAPEIRVSTLLLIHWPGSLRSSQLTCRTVSAAR